MNIEQSNLAALTSTEPVIAGRKLQPFSAGRLQLCRRVGLQIITGGAGALQQAELELELLAFYFIHAFPLDTMIEACALPREKFFGDHIEPLSFEFPARELPKVMEFIQGEFGAVDAANVEAEPKAGTHGSVETPPPNT